MQPKEEVALVTGAASGIGFACARTLLLQGARVLVNDLNEGPLEDARQALAGSDGIEADQILTAAADVTDADAVAGMFQRVLGQWGAVSILVNNAGVSGGRRALAEITADMWDEMMAANVRGMYLCTRCVLPHMYKRAWGRVVNMASIAAISGRLMASAHYSAAKGAIAAFTRRVAIEAAPHNVAVNCVAPGLTADTGFTRAVTGDLLEQYLERIPAGRPATCDEIAELVAFLCSRHAGYIIGQTIVIDGGAST